MTQEPDYKALWEAEQARANQLQQRLAEAEHKMNSLFEEAGDSIFIVDFADYTILDANTHASRRLGYTHDELIGMSLDDIEVNIDMDMDSSWVSEFSGTQVYECYHRHADGKLILIEVSSRVVKFNQREVILMFARNMELRKQLQERNLQLTLEQERVALLTNFIQNAGHEFRTPLAIIATSIYLMKKLSNDIKIAEKSEQIDEQVKRITDLVNRLLLMAKLESEGQCAQQPLQVYSILHPLFEHYQQHYGEEPRLSAQIPDDLPLILGDEKYLTIAMEQLLDNAYRFTPADGHIHIKADAGTHHILIEIQDTGCGIDDADIEHVFDTFWRKDQAHSTPGFGLGLPIAQRIIDQHGGAIHMHSVPDAGTTVQVTLPFEIQSDV